MGGIERQVATQPETQPAPQPETRPAPQPENQPAIRPETRPEAAPARPSAGRAVPETAQTLDRGLRLLALIAESSDGVTVSDAAARLGVGRTVVYRLAATLIDHDLVRRDSGGRLRPAAGLLRLGRNAQSPLVSAVAPILRRLAEHVGATAHLTLAEGDEAVALSVVEPTWTHFHVAYRVGSRHPLSRGAAGRAILAGRRGDHGWQVSAGELQPGAYGVAAAVPGVEGLDASVGVVALASLDASAVGPRVVAAAAAVARALR